MKKTFRSILAGALALLAVSCYDDTLIREKIDTLADRVTKLEADLNADIANLNTLQGKVNDLETSLKKAISEGDAAVTAAIEKKLENLETELSNALAQGDQAVIAKINEEKAALTEALTGLQNGLQTVTGNVATLQATIATLESQVGLKYQELVAQMDAADNVIDGKIADLTAALDVVKKACLAADAAHTQKEAELAANLASAVAKIVVSNVSEVNGKVVITLVDGSKFELSKPLANVDNEGLITTVEVDGVKYWAVVKDGEPESLGIMVGANVSLNFRVGENNMLEYTVNGTDWIATGAYVSDSAEGLLNFYQGETDEIDWETYEYIKEDFYTLVFGGEEYFLPIYKVDNSVVMVKSGKTYFTYGETKTIDVVLSDISSIYLMSKPEGWRANYADKKLTVTAPDSVRVATNYAEAYGEILLHCTTSEGKCKIAKLNVATTAGFSLVVTKDGKLTITNPEVVTQTDMWGNTMTDFNDAYIGLAPVAAFEADPIKYVETIDYNSNDKWYYLSNWKMNTAEVDEDWNMIYTIGGEYKPGEYEIDVIETTIPSMYADWTYGQEIPAEPYIVWACPMNENGMPRIDDLVYGYYYPSIKATITEVSKSTSDVEVSVSVVGATNYYVGLVAEEQLYGFPIDQYMQMQEGPFGYFQMALQYGMRDYAFQQMGTQFGGEFGEVMPETITASLCNYGQPLMPNTKFYMWVFPIVDGLELADYTYEENLKPYIYEFTTDGLSAGGSATVEFGEASLSFSAMSVELASEGATMIYYNWFDTDTYNAFANDAAITEALLSEGYVIGGDMGIAVNQGQVAPGAEFFLVALAVDAEGKYGDFVDQLYSAPTLTFSETFKASFGQPESSVYYSGYRYNFPIAVEGGEAAKYYYVWSTTQYTDDQLANLPLTYEYDYNFRSTTNVAAGQLAGQYANASSTYYLAVVVESTTGELSSPIKLTVEVPAVTE